MTSIRVTVTYASPGVERIVGVDLAPGSTVLDAVQASGLITRSTPSREPLQYAIFGRRALAMTPVRDGDRIDLTRPLRVSPSDARRARAGRILP